VEVAHRTDGVEAAVALARRRSGRHFDPDLVACFVEDVEKVFHGLDEVTSWDAVLDEEPVLSVRLSEDDCDAALAAIARFVDLKTPFLLGHSEATAALAAEAGRQLGLTDVEARTLHRVGRRSSGPAGLTAQEVRVLQLLARGSSNRQIAERLVISPKTVGNHVEHLYTKIGATNRAEASLFAMRHGLLPNDAAGD